MRLLKRNWRAVSALADALVECRGIEGRDVVAIIDHRSRMTIL
jgi:hypothetical protein